MKEEAIIFFISIIASFIGAIGGGGSLITIPTFIFLGLPPQAAIAINRTGGIGLSIGSLLRFYRSGKIQWHLITPLAILSVIGVLLGSKLMIDTSPIFLEKIIGALILSIVLLNFFVKNTFGLKSFTPTKKQKYIGYVLYFIITILGGYFGGIGAFIILIYAAFFGVTLVASNATESVVRLIGSTASVIYLYFAGFIDPYLSLFVITGMIIGGYIGAHIQIKEGNRFVKYFMLVTVSLMAIKLLFFS